MPKPRRPRTFAVVLVAIVASTAIPVSEVHAAPIFYNGAGSAPRISVIGDSTVAALRWSGQLEPLRRFNFTYDAESCRRTVVPSCRGREGYAPDTTLNAMRRLSGRLGSVLFIMGGYDDSSYNFGSAVDAVMAEAARQRLPTVVWLTLRSNVTYVGPGGISYSGTFRAINRVLVQKAIQYGPRLQIADWASYSANHPEWFYADGIHFRPAGANVLAEYIAAQAARVLNGQTITPLAGQARPLAPRALRASVGHGVGTGRVRLTWTANSAVGGGPVTDYVIQRSWNDGLSWVTLDDGVSTSRVYTATNLTDRATYQFRVAARNMRGLGAWSNVVTATPIPTIASPPRSLIAWTYAGQVTLAWIVPSSSGGQPVTAYRIQLSTDGGRTWVNAAGIRAPTRRYTVRGLTNGVTYQFRVMALNAVGWSPVSNLVTATPRLTAPWPPRSLKAWVYPDRVSLDWTAPASDGGEPVTAYRIQRSTDGGRTWVNAAGIRAPTRRYTLTGLTAGVTYQYRVMALNAVGWSRGSNVVTATPTAAEATALLAAEPTTTFSVPTTTTSTSSTTTTTTAVTTAEPVETAVFTIGDLVWLDANGDGLQDPDEKRGVEGVDVVLLDASGGELARDTTDEFGLYKFVDVSDGSYVLELELPDGFEVTLPDQGPDDEFDSDLVAVDEQLRTARTDVFAVPAAEPHDAFDLGLVDLTASTPTSSGVDVTEVPTSDDPITVAPTDPPTTETTTTAPTEPPTTEAPTTAAPTTSEAPTTVVTTTTAIASSTTEATGG